MRFNPQIAATRFGTGLGPTAVFAGDAGGVLASLDDDMAGRFPIGHMVDHADYLSKYRDLAKARRKGEDGAREAQKALRIAMKDRSQDWFRATLARQVAAPVGFHERLSLFWTDHFTVEGKQAVYRPLVATFTEDAIQPHITGRFADMLKAVVTHPIMLHYLDQFASVGEGSVVGQQAGKGLNENLAREVLELHTLGVGGSYTQTDVREFAKLLAGFRYDGKGGAVYRARRASPGAEVILGKAYGDDTPRVEDVYQALEDIAAHPDTARHLAWKLAVHFVADRPDPELVAHIAAAYLRSGGDLMACYEALLEHPAAWAPEAQKVRRPIEFITASLRALGITPKAIMAAETRIVMQSVVVPMRMMGQPWERPPGPDGWPEDAGHWITPQGLAARLQWAMTVPAAITNPLPDPRNFARTALGDLIDSDTDFAARAAATRWEGVGLVLASPRFQMR